MDYGQLVVELVGDYSKLKASMASARLEALKNAEELERIYKLSPSLDTTELKRNVETLGLESGRSLAKNLQAGLNAQKITLTNVSIDARSLRKVGVEVGTGLAEGIRQSNSQARKASGDMAGLVIDETKRKLKIHSPSLVFKEIGENIVQGLASGLATGGTLAVGSLINGVISTAKSAVDKAFEFTGEGIQKYANQKATLAQLSIQLGNQKDAVESLKFVRQESDRLGISLENSQAQFAKLVSNAKGSKLSLDELKEVYTGFNTLGRINQLSNDDLKGVFVGLEQTFSKGRIQAEELRGQIAERLPGALAIVSKALGVTQAQLDKLLVSGQLKPDQVWLLFAREVQKEYGSKLSDSLNNSTVGFTKLANTIYELQTSLGQAVEPAVISGLTFVTDGVKQLGQAGLFNDLNLGAQQFSEYLKQNPELAKETADIISNALKNALNYVVTLSSDLLKYLKDNPNAIADAASAMGKFGQGIGEAVGFAKDLLGIFVKIGETIDGFYGKLSQVFGGTPEQQEKFKRFLQYGPITLIPGFPGGANSGNSNSNSQGGVSAASGMAGAVQMLTDPDKAHHTNGRAYRKHDGQVLRGGLLTKDLVFAGGTNAPIPAPIGGTVKLRTDDPNGYGNYADILDPNGKLLARLAHLSKFADGLQSGQVIKPGQIVGNQGSTGRSSGNHLHIEMPREYWASYIQALKTGNYSTLPGGSGIQTGGIAGIANGTAAIVSQQQKTTRQVQQSVSNNPANNNSYLWGKAAQYSPSDLSGLTSVGQKALEALKNPNVRAFLDAIAVAEVGETANKTGGYGLLFGDNGKETFNPNTLTSHPKQRRRSGKYVSSATGRYQTMDFVWDDDTAYGSRGLGLRDFKPQSQEVLAVGRLMYRGILDEVKAGNIQGALKGAGREWASVQGNPYGQGTVGGKTSVLLANFEKFRNNTLPTTSTSPGQTPANIQSILRQEEEKAMISRRNAIRQSQDQSRAAIRTANDAYYVSELNPSQDAKNARAAAEKLRQIDDQALTLRRQQEDARSRITINQEKVNSGSLTENELADTQLTLKLDKQLIQDLDNSLNSLAETRKKTSDEYAKFNERDRQFRIQQSDLRLDQLSNEVLQSKINGLKELQNLNPYAKQLEALPELERELALRQQEVKNKQELLALDQAYSKNEVDPIEYAVRTEQLKKLNTEEVRNIDLKYQNAKAAERQRVNTLELNKVLRDLGDISEGPRLKSSLREYGIGDSDRFEMDRDAGLAEQYGKNLQERDQLTERARLEQMTPEQLAGERIRLALRDNQQRALINAQYNRQIEDRDFNSGVRVSESLQNLLSAQAEQRSGLGLDARPLQKQAAILSQNLDFRNQIRDLQRLRDSGDITADAFEQVKSNLEALNQVKLDSINNEFSEWTDGIKNIRSEFENVTKGFILGTESIESAFSKLFSSILDNLASLASKQLSEQLFGSIFGGRGKTPDFVGGGLLESLGGLVGGSSGFGFDSLLGFGSFGGDAFGSALGDFGIGDMATSIIQGFSKGGIVGSIADGMAKERSQSGRQPYLIIAHKGERVLTPSEAEIYNKIESQGRLNYSNGGMVGSSIGNPRIAIASGSSDTFAPTFVVNAGNSPNVDPQAFLKVAENTFHRLVRDEKRPGGSLSQSRGEVYGR